jgi:hypothetical protein
MICTATTANTSRPGMWPDVTNSTQVERATAASGIVGMSGTPICHWRSSSQECDRHWHLIWQHAAQQVSDCLDFRWRARSHALLAAMSLSFLFMRDIETSASVLPLDPLPVAGHDAIGRSGKRSGVSSPIAPPRSFNMCSNTPAMAVSAMSGHNQGLASGPRTAGRACRCRRHPDGAPARAGLPEAEPGRQAPVTAFGVAGTPGGRITSTNPARTSEVVADVSLGDASVFVAAAQAAREAQPT